MSAMSLASAPLRPPAAQSAMHAGRESTSFASARPPGWKPATSAMSAGGRTMNASTCAFAACTRRSTAAARSLASPPPPGGWWMFQGAAEQSPPPPPPEGWYPGKRLKEGGGWYPGKNLPRSVEEEAP